jgi:hypothetical protein
MALNIEYCYSEWQHIFIIMLNVVMLSVTMLRVTMLSVIMLNVVTPFKHFRKPTALLHFAPYP